VLQQHAAALPGPPGTHAPQQQQQQPPPPLLSALLSPPVSVPLLLLLLLPPVYCAATSTAYITAACGLLCFPPLPYPLWQLVGPDDYTAVLVDFGSARRIPLPVKDRTAALALQEEAEVCY
jgi:hypothetical protein